MKADFEKDKETLTFGLDSDNYAFDYHFAQAQLQKPSETTNEDSDDSEDEEIPGTLKTPEAGIVISKD